MNQSNKFFWKLSIPTGCHWSSIIPRGTTLRLTDTQGNANVSALFYNQEEKLERYNMADTLKAQHTFYLTKGHACYSDMGRIFCLITADTVGWHDTVCGLSDQAMIKQKYGATRYQEQQNQMYRNGLDGMLIELGKWGLGIRDLVSNINFFSKVTANSQGQLTFHPNHSQAGDYIDLSFQMDTITVFSMAPHPLDTAATYPSGVVELSTFHSTHSTEPVNLQHAENSRGLLNTQQLYNQIGEIK